ncbi:MAG: dipicolinate synthase subunit DpsA [Clostridia bacterium]|nr:dipicolinate synthase subunit DpsA [Clostridia bacterium]
MEATYNIKKLAVIGGDLRSLVAAGALRAAGFECAVWGFDSAHEGTVHGSTVADSLCCSAAASAIGELSPQLAITLRENGSCASLEEALDGSFGVILPLPATQDGVRVSMPLSGKELALDTLLRLMEERGIRLLCGGRLGEDFSARCAGRGIEAFDYYEQEEFAVANAIPTAEGAIAIAMNELAVTLHGGRALVIGYGRIGKVLARLLHGLGMEVTVSARKPADFAWIAADRLRAAETGKLGGLFADWQPDVIFNTVPHRVLDRSLLAAIHPGTLIIDLASKPGGVDIAAAGELGHNVIWALSLPGKVAPVTAGKIIADTVSGYIRRNERELC